MTGQDKRDLEKDRNKERWRMRRRERRQTKSLAFTLHPAHHVSVVRGKKRKRGRQRQTDEECEKKTC